MMEAVDIKELTVENYEGSCLTFGDRQAGISHVYSPGNSRFYYHVYCVDRKSLTDIFSVEYEFLTDALETVNSEFAGWERQEYEAKSLCSTCKK